MNLTLNHYWARIYFASPYAEKTRRCMDLSTAKKWIADMLARYGEHPEGKISGADITEVMDDSYNPSLPQEREVYSWNFLHGDVTGFLDKLEKPFAP